MPTKEFVIKQRCLSLQTKLFDSYQALLSFDEDQPDLFIYSAVERVLEDLTTCFQNLIFRFRAQLPYQETWTECENFVNKYNFLRLEIMFQKLDSVLYLVEERDPILLGMKQMYDAMVSNLRVYLQEIGMVNSSIERVMQLIQEHCEQ